MSSGDDLSSDDQTVRTLRKKAAESIEESDGKDKMFYLSVRIKCFISTLKIMQPCKGKLDRELEIIGIFTYL